MYKRQPYEFGVYATATDGAKSELGSATATPDTVDRMPDSEPTSPRANQPQYWERRGYGTCTKEEVEDVFGSVWRLDEPANALILKSGTDNDVWVDPMGGLYGTASAKDISHVIVCMDHPQS